MQLQCVRHFIFSNKYLKNSIVLHAQNITALNTDEIKATLHKRYLMRVVQCNKNVDLLSDVFERVFKLFYCGIISRTFRNHKSCVLHTFEFFFAVSNGLLDHSLLIIVHRIEFKASCFCAHSFLPRLFKMYE